MMRFAGSARSAPAACDGSATACEQRLRIERAAAELGALLAAEQHEPAVDERAEVLRLDRDHRAAVREVDVADRADHAGRQRAALAVDDDRAQPRRRDLAPRLDAAARVERIVVLRGEFGHAVLRDDRLDRDAEMLRGTAVQRPAFDDARAALEAAGLHDPRTARQREAQSARRERVEQRDERERRRRDADRNGVGLRPSQVGDQALLVEDIGVQVPAVRAVAALARDGADGWYLHADVLDEERLIADLARAQTDAVTVCIATTAFALVALLDALAARG